MAIDQSKFCDHAIEEAARQGRQGRKESTTAAPPVVQPPQPAQPPKTLRQLARAADRSIRRAPGDTPVFLGENDVVQPLPAYLCTICGGPAQVLRDDTSRGGYGGPNLVRVIIVTGLVCPRCARPRGRVAGIALFLGQRNGTRGAGRALYRTVSRDKATRVTRVSKSGTSRAL